jgi:hypothetical protein
MKTYMTHGLMAFLLWGFVAHTCAQDLDLASLVKLSKQMRAKELSDSLNRNTAAAATAAPVGTVGSFNVPPPPPPPPPEPPILKMVLGVNDVMQAEVAYDGQWFVLRQGMPPAAGLGPWKYSYVFSDGALLTTKPVNLSAARQAQPELTEPLSEKPVCQWLKLSIKQCLFLVPVPTQLHDDGSGMNKAQVVGHPVFQDQVRNLVSQSPTAPTSYAPPSTLAVANGNNARPASNEPIPVRTGVFPK